MSTARTTSRFLKFATTAAIAAVASLAIPRPAEAFINVCNPRIVLENNTNQPISVKYLRAAKAGDSTLTRHNIRDTQLNPGQRSAPIKESMSGLEDKYFRLQAVYDTKGGERQGFIKESGVCRDDQVYVLPVAAPSNQPTAQDMFSTKQEARQRSKQLKKCKGTHSVGNFWRPCKNAAQYQKAIANN